MKRFAVVLALLLCFSCGHASELPTPAYVENLLAVASGELGYEEGANNYSKYGEWAGDANAAWCAEFLGWCVHQTDLRFGTNLLDVVYPNYSGQNTGRNWFIGQGRFVYRKGMCPSWGYQWMLGAEDFLSKDEYLPRAGDWVFFSLNGADTWHVALVTHTTTEANQVLVHVIEGNNPSSVATNQYALTDSTILGYGTPVKVVGTTMRFGNQGQAVKELQDRLVDLGFLAKEQASGTFGSQTRAAITAFQDLYLPDKTSSIGIADRETQAMLDCAYEAVWLNDPNTWLVTE